MFRLDSKSQPLDSNVSQPIIDSLKKLKAVESEVISKINGLSEVGKIDLRQFGDFTWSLLSSLISFRKTFNDCVLRFGEEAQLLIKHRVSKSEEQINLGQLGNYLLEIWESAYKVNECMNGLLLKLDSEFTHERFHTSNIVFFSEHVLILRLAHFRLGQTSDFYFTYLVQTLNQLFIDVSKNPNSGKIIELFNFFNEKFLFYLKGLSDTSLSDELEPDYLKRIGYLEKGLKTLAKELGLNRQTKTLTKVRVPNSEDEKN